MTTPPQDALDEFPVFPEDDGAPARRLDYLGYAPCPVRREMQRRLHLHFLRHAAEFGPVAWYSPGGCGSKGDPYDLVWKAGNEEDMPGAISDGGHSDFFRREGHRRWIESGVYGPIDRRGLRVRPEFAEAGIDDPCQAIHIYASFPSVLLVDHRKLGALPAPRTWADLMNPAYRGGIAATGHPGRAPDILLFNYWKNFGDSGLAAFAANVADFRSPAQIAKTAGTPAGSAIAVVNRFFALGNRRPGVEIVWPEDGAWFNPLTLLARRGRRPASDLALDCLLGADWAAYLESVGLPPVFEFPGQKALPGRLAWMGWDLIRGHDIDALREKLQRVFDSAR